MSMPEPDKQTKAQARKTSPSSRPAAGFTLLELITAVAIVAVLAGLLSAALNQAKGRAHQITCLNNLRQFQMAWTLYAEDNEDFLAHNFSEPSLDEARFGRRNAPGSWVTGNPKEDLETGGPDQSIANLRKGTLYSYLKTPTVYRCPSGAGAGGQTRGMRSYSMSTYMNGDALPTESRVKVSLAEVQSQPASEVFVFIEEHVESPWIGSFLVAPAGRAALSASAATSRFASVPGPWHNGGSDLSFADGHVEFWRWSSLGKKHPGGAGVQARAESDDVRRLQNAIPSP